MRLGILGGSFNPPHVAHLAMARAARDAHDLDKVILVPAGSPPHKSEGLAPAADRLEMVRLAVAGDERLEASALEIERPGPSYTYETLSQLHALHPGAELFFVMGDDSLRDLPEWRMPGRIMELCRVVVVNRPGVQPAAIEDRLDSLPPGPVEQLKKDRVAMPPCDVSASRVRARLQAGESVENLVPRAVASYIEEHGLYR